MAITRLTGFSGTADVLGIVREFKFESGNLLIGSLTLDDAHAALKALSTGIIAVIDPLDKTKAQVAKSAKSETNGHATPTQQMTTKVDPAALANLPPIDKIREANAPKPDTKPEPEKTQPVTALADTTTPDEVKPVAMGPASGDAIPSGDAVKGNPTGAGVVTAEAPNSSLPDAVKNAKRFTVVVDYFIGQGIKDAADLVKACEAIRAEVPLLGRIPNLADRVKSALEAAG